MPNAYVILKMKVVIGGNGKRRIQYRVKMVNKYGNDSLINFSILLTAELLRMFRLALVLFF